MPVPFTRWTIRDVKAAFQKLGERQPVTSLGRAVASGASGGGGDVASSDLALALGASGALLLLAAAVSLQLPLKGAALMRPAAVPSAR